MPPPPYSSSSSPLLAYQQYEKQDGKQMSSQASQLKQTGQVSFVWVGETICPIYPKSWPFPFSQSAFVTVLKTAAAATVD